MRLIRNATGFMLGLVIAICAGLALIPRAHSTEPKTKPVAVMLTACTEVDDKGRVVLIAIDVLMSDKTIVHYDKGDPNALLNSMPNVVKKMQRIDCTHGTAS